MPTLAAGSGYKSMKRDGGNVIDLDGAKWGIESKTPSKVAASPPLEMEQILRLSQPGLVVWLLNGAECSGGGSSP